MSILNRLFGFRWSVYIVRNGSELVYALHEHCPITLTGYLLSYFKDGKEPLLPWSLHLNYNRKQQSFQLHSRHFRPDGEGQSAELIAKIAELDPNWRDRRGAEPVFVQAATKRKLKLSDATFPVRSKDLQRMIDEVGKPQEVTFYSVMDEVFGVDC